MMQSPKTLHGLCWPCLLRRGAAWASGDRQQCAAASRSLLKPVIARSCWRRLKGGLMGERLLCTACDWPMLWQPQPARHAALCCLKRPTQQQCAQETNAVLTCLVVWLWHHVDYLAPNTRRWARAIVLLAEKELRSPAQAVALDALTAFAPAVRPVIGERSTKLVHTLTRALARCKPFRCWCGSLHHCVYMAFASESRRDLCHRVYRRSAGSPSERPIGIAALHAFAALQPQCPTRTERPVAKGLDPAALLAAAITASGTDGSHDDQLSNAAVTAIAALLIPQRQRYGHGESRYGC